MCVYACIKSHQIEKEDVGDGAEVAVVQEGDDDQHVPDDAHHEDEREGQDPWPLVRRQPGSGGHQAAFARGVPLASPRQTGADDLPPPGPVVEEQAQFEEHLLVQEFEVEWQNGRRQ